MLVPMKRIMSMKYHDFHVFRNCFAVLPQCGINKEQA